MKIMNDFSPDILLFIWTSRPWLEPLGVCYVGCFPKDRLSESAITCFCELRVLSVARSVARTQVTARRRSSRSQEVRQGKEQPHLLPAGSTFTWLLLAPGRLLQGGATGMESSGTEL